MNAREERPNGKRIKMKILKINAVDQKRLRTMNIDNSLDAKFGKSERFKGRWT